MSSKGKSKEISMKSLEMIKAGGQSGQNNGPTGSARTYAKGKAPSMSTDFNPQKHKPCGYVVGR